MEKTKINKLKIVCGCLTFVLAVICGYYFWNYRKYFVIKDFSKRIISMATALNVNVDGVVKIYFLFVASSFVSLWLLADVIGDFSVKPTKKPHFNIKINNNSKKIIGCLFILAAVVYLSISYYTSFRTILLLVILVKGFYGYKGNIGNIVKDIVVVFLTLNNCMMVYYFFAHFFDSKVVLSSSIIKMFVLFLAIYLCHLSDCNEQEKLMEASMISTLCSIAVYVAVELLYTLRSRGLALKHGTSVYLSFFILFCILIFFLFKKGIIKKAENKKYILSVIAFVWFGCLRTQNFDFPNELFESANHGISIMDTVIFHKIPVINDFDAHMLSNTFTGILHYLINGNYYEALSIPYTYIYTIIFYVLVFYILKKSCSEELAYMSVILLSTTDFVFADFMIGIYLLLVYFWWTNKNNVKSDIVFWVAAAISVIFRLDVGMAFGVPAVIMAFAYIIIKKEFKRFYRFLAVGISVAAFCLLVLNGILSIYGKNFSVWIKNFVNVCLSNQNWGYGVLTNNDNELWNYIIYPVISVIVYLIIKKCVRLTYEQNMVCIYILLAFLFNTTRLVVRHSLIEDINYLKQFFMLLYFISGVYVVDKIYMYFIGKKINITEILKKDKLKNLDKKDMHLKDLISLFDAKVFDIAVTLAVIALALMLVTHFMKCNEKIGVNIKYCTQSIKTKYDDNIPELPEDVDEFCKIENMLLHKDETFLDFSNSTELYTVLKKENPLYVNQTPALINGEYGQLEAIYEIEHYKNTVPLVLMQNQINALDKDGYKVIKANSSVFSIDGIFNMDRYYLLAEYIYTNYEPLFISDYNEIWCKKDRWEEYSKKIDPNNLFDYNSSNIKYIHSLGFIPYIWANLDSVDIEKSIYSEKSRCVIEDFDEVDKSSGNYLVFEINSDMEVDSFDVEVSYKNGNQDLFSFNLKEGNNFYIIRISSCYDWYISEINNITMQKSSVAELLNIYCTIAE